jgi:hypothetical protein
MTSDHRCRDTATTTTSVDRKSLNITSGGVDGSGETRSRKPQERRWSLRLTLPGAPEIALWMKFLLKKINEINGRIWAKTGGVGKSFSVDCGCIFR